MRRPVTFNCLAEAGQTEKQNCTRNPAEVLKGNGCRLWPPCWVSLQVENSFTQNTQIYTELQPGLCKTILFLLSNSTSYLRSIWLVIEATASHAELYPQRVYETPNLFRLTRCNSAFLFTAENQQDLTASLNFRLRSILDNTQTRIFQQR